MSIERMNKAELMDAILIDCEELYNSLDEQKFLSGGYSEDELRNKLAAWIINGSETGTVKNEMV